MKKLIIPILALSLSVSGCIKHLPVREAAPLKGATLAPDSAPFDFEAAKRMAEEKKARCQRLSNLEFWTGFTGIGLGVVSTTLGVIAQAKDEGSNTRETLLDIATATGGGATLSQSLQQYVKSEYASNDC